MAKQIPSTPSNKKISELYKRVKEKTLVLQPDFQRKFVWTSSHKESFIDTILQGLPFPEIYTAQSGIDIEKIETQEVVVDGQQRLSTIVQYIDENVDSKIFGKNIPKFKQLSIESQKDFLNYNVVIRDLEDISSEVIREVFKRINQTKFNLLQIEIQNAIYDGEFINEAKSILEKIDIKHIPIFSDSEMSRMSDLHFLLLVMTTLELGGYFTRDSEIEKMIIENNDFYPNKNIISSKVINTLKTIKKLELSPDSIWYRKSNFFTLVIETSNKNIDNLLKFKASLLEFENNILKNKYEPKETNQFSFYYSYMYTGTNSRQARVIRADIFNENIITI